MIIALASDWETAAWALAIPAAATTARDTPAMMGRILTASPF
jgi:hypothetical protein